MREDLNIHGLYLSSKVIDTSSPQEIKGTYAIRRRRLAHGTHLSVKVIHMKVPGDATRSRPTIGHRTCMSAEVFPDNHGHGQARTGHTGQSG